MDTCAIKVDRNEKYSGLNFSKGTENTSDTSKKEDGKSRNVRNIIFNFY